MLQGHDYHIADFYTPYTRCACGERMGLWDHDEHVADVLIAELGLD